jgi:hypothetical protein
MRWKSVKIKIAFENENGNESGNQNPNTTGRRTSPMRQQNMNKRKKSNPDNRSSSFYSKVSISVDSSTRVLKCFV